MSEKKKIVRGQTAVGRGVEATPRLEVSLRTLSVCEAAAGVVIRDVFFEGGDILRCYAGRFQFTLGGGEPFEIGAGEALVIYPGQRVTIVARAKRNVLRYAVFDGTGVEAYFDRFGFYDGLHGRTSTQLEVFEAMRRQLQADAKVRGNPGNTELPSPMHDALVTYAHDFRENGNPLVFDAIRQIRRNLREGVVRLKELCEELKVSRSHLHRAFVAQGLGGVSGFVKGEQVRLALRLLRDSRRSIAEIAHAVGFASVPHFATFVKRRTGHAPRDLRR